MKMICEYCGQADGEEDKYHPTYCAHCGASLAHVFGTYFGKPITEYAEFMAIIKDNPPFAVPVFSMR